MNVLLRKLKIHLLLLGFLSAAQLASGQSPDFQVHEITILKNDTMRFEFEDYDFIRPKITRTGIVPNSSSKFEETNSIHWFVQRLEHCPLHSTSRLCWKRYARN